jgi:glycosyltransferase involved in cell wall biosynthesis
MSVHPLLKKISLRLVEDRNLRRSAAVHFTTDAERIQMPGGFPPGSFVLPMPVDEKFSSETVTRGSFRSRYSIPSGARLMLFLSRVHPGKGLEVLVEIASILNRGGSETWLAIAGTGPDHYVSSIKNLVARFGIDSNVVWTGHLDIRGKIQAMDDADLCVLLSQSESMGLGVAESLARGLPVVVSSGVGLADDVREAEAGSVVDPRDPGSVADQIVSLLSDPVRSTDMKRRARSLGARFSAQAVAGELVSRYESIIRATRR